jgi:hypothetical protein
LVLPSALSSGVSVGLCRQHKTFPGQLRSFFTSHAPPSPIPFLDTVTGAEVRWQRGTVEYREIPAGSRANPGRGRRRSPAPLPSDRVPEPPRPDPG